MSSFIPIKLSLESPVSLASSSDAANSWFYADLSPQAERKGSIDDELSFFNVVNRSIYQNIDKVGFEDTQGEKPIFLGVYRDSIELIKEKRGIIGEHIDPECNNEGAEIPLNFFESDSKEVFFSKVQRLDPGPKKDEYLESIILHFLDAKDIDEEKESIKRFSCENRSYDIFNFIIHHKLRKPHHSAYV